MSAPKKQAVLRPGASAVVFDDAGQVLVQQRSDNGLWALPAGGLELGESLAQCCVREVLEETGLNVEVLRLVGVYSDPSVSMFFYPNGDVIQSVAACFVCRVVGGALQINEESLSLRWVQPNEIPEPFFENHRVRLHDALEERQAAFWR